MTQIHDIRKLYFEEGKNITQISVETGHDRKTVRGYIQKEDWNTPKPKAIPVAEFPKLDPFKKKLTPGLQKIKRPNASKDIQPSESIIDWLKNTVQILIAHIEP